MQISEQDQKFIELAIRDKILLPQEAVFCEERMNLGISPALTAMSEGFMSREEVGKVYEMLGIPDFPEITAVVDETEQKIVEEIRHREWLPETAWTFCRREQKRLAKMGHHVPLSAVILASGCLDMAKMAEICGTVVGKDRVAVLAECEAEDGMPPIRRFDNYVKRKQRKAQDALPAEVQMMQQLQKVLEEPVAPRKPKEAKGRKKTPPLAAEEMPERPVALPHEAAPVLDKPLSATGMTVLSEDAVKALVAQFAEVVEKSLVKFWTDEKSSEEPDSAEKKAYKQGKQYVSKREALDLLQKGGSLDKVYIPELQISGVTLPKNISITNSCIEKLDLAEVTFEGDIDFEGTVFLEKAVFRESTFAGDALLRKTLFIDGADFAKVKFSGNAHFNSANFRRYVSFNHSRFEKKTVFSRAYFAKGVKFAEVSFASGGSFNEIGCDHRFQMEKCHFHEDATFSNAYFNDVADFSRSTFDKVAKFKGTQFAKWASFNYGTFKDEIHLNGTTSSGDLSFKWTNLEGLVDMKTLCGERNVDFSNAKVGGRAVFALMDAYFGRLFLTREQLEGHLDSHIQNNYRIAQKEYGLMKNNFREINEYDREDWAYQMEKRMERYGIKVKGVRSACKRFFNWLALDLACGYGTKPLNIFLTSLIALALFALVYQVLGVHFIPAGQGLSFWEAVQISFRTFTNAEVGGREVGAASWINYIMMFESFMGFFIMTVLVVTFSRKVIR